MKEKKYETVDTTSRMLAATMNVIGQTSMMNVRFGSEKGSGSNLRDQKNPGSSTKTPMPSVNNTAATNSQNLKATIVHKEDEKVIS